MIKIIPKKIFVFKFYIVILQYRIYKTMGSTKTTHFTNEQNEMAVLAKALGHPARIAIMEYLLSVDACICGDILNELPLAQATVSQHLKELKNAGLIQGTIEGNAICYCVNETTLEKFNTYLQQLTSKMGSRTRCC